VQLKLFRAETVAAAMAQIREELGGEAMILSTRRVAGGVELTAGLETEPLGAPLPNGAEPVARGYAPAAREPGADPDRADLLAWHGVPLALARKLRAGPMPFALSAALRFAPLPLQPGGEPLLMAGPPGAGKTLTVARLATRLVLSGVRPLVITADARRAGSAEHLAAFTRLLGLDLLAASQPDTLARALARRVDGAPVLIDTPGADPFDRGEQAMLAALAEAARAAVVAVLPAGLDAGEAAEIAGLHVAASTRLLVSTRLDLSRRLGSVCAAAAAGLALAEFGIGPGAADGLVPATPALLAQRLLSARPTPPSVLAMHA
jgi:flagellar biosynthesis protein FlhF